MAVSLKGSNNLGLYGLIATNLIVFYIFVNTGSLFEGNLAVFIKKIDEAIPAGIGLVLTGILNAQVSAETKARIVFMRWKYPLPGCQAFTKYAHDDYRVNIGKLQKEHGPLPKEPREQNALWYRLYKSLASEPAVQQVHRAFLFTRDYTFLSLLMMIVLGIAAFIQIPSIDALIIYISIMIVQFFLAGQAARNHGKRFVTTVLAIKSAES